MTTEDDYFSTDEYLAYLATFCGPDVREDAGRVVGTDFIEQMLGHMPFTSGASVLEIGCGLGRVMRLLQGVWDLDAWGCDTSAPAIEEAKRLSPAMDDRFFVSPAERVHINRRFDHVVYWGVFEMTAQRLALVELSRLLNVGGTAMLSGVKNATYHLDDDESLAAHRAYIAKSFPITYTDIAAFEEAVDFLGLQVEQRLVFDRKQDVADHAPRLDTGDAEAPTACSDIYYILRKVRATPLDATFQYEPSELRVPGAKT